MGRRIWAYVIDLVLLDAFGFVDFVVLTHWFGRGHSVLIALLVLQLVVILGYGAVLIGWRGATVGMSAAKLIAVDRVTCRILHWRRAWARAVTAFALTGLALDVLTLSGFTTSQPGIQGSIAAGAFLVPLAGYGTYLYWARWDALHQTLQDKVGSSIVLYTGSRRAGRRPKWSWRAAASRLGRQYAGGYSTPLGRKGF